MNFTGVLPLVIPHHQLMNVYKKQLSGTSKI